MCRGVVLNGEGGGGKEAKGRRGQDLGEGGKKGSLGPRFFYCSSFS